MKHNSRKRVYRRKKDILDFFEAEGVQYLSRPQVDWKPLLAMDLSTSPYYQTNIDEFNLLTEKYGKYIASSWIAPVHIKKVSDHVGLGLFASEDIKKGEFIGEYAGVVQVSGKYNDIYEEEGYESDYSWYYPDELEDAPALEINGRMAGNEMRFVNHSDKPNVVVEHTIYDNQWVLFFVAGKKIKKGEQLLISYGEAYWEDGYSTKG